MAPRPGEAANLNLIGTSAPISGTNLPLAARGPGTVGAGRSVLITEFHWDFAGWYLSHPCGGTGRTFQRSYHSSEWNSSDKNWKGWLLRLLISVLSPAVCNVLHHKMRRCWRSKEEDSVRVRWRINLTLQIFSNAVCKIRRGRN